jgi:hypothetical protein
MKGTDGSASNPIPVRHTWLVVLRFKLSSVCHRFACAAVPPAISCRHPPRVNAGAAPHSRRLAHRVSRPDRPTVARPHCVGRSGRPTVGHATSATQLSPDARLLAAPARGAHPASPHRPPTRRAKVPLLLVLSRRPLILNRPRATIGRSSSTAKPVHRRLRHVVRPPLP